MMVYNNSIHSVTKPAPMKVLNGHFDQESLFTIDLEKQLVNVYVNQHRDELKLGYKEINEREKELEEELIGRINHPREKLSDIPEAVYMKNKQKQGITKPKYKAEKIKTINKNN